MNREPNVLERVAVRVEAGLPLKSVWPAIHAECKPVDTWYGNRLGESFGALAAEADCDPYYLGDVLRKRYDEPDKMVALLRAAGTRLR